MNPRASTFLRQPLRAFLRAALLHIVVLGIGMSACVQRDTKDVMTAERDLWAEPAAKNLQGAWIVDGKAYFERELGVSTPQFVDELLRGRKTGYVIDGDTIEYWVATPRDQYVARSKYTIAAQDAQSVDIRPIEGENRAQADEVFGEAQVLRFRFVEKDHVALQAVFDEDDDPDTRPSIPLERVDRNAFEAHFHVTPPVVQEEDVAAYLQGAWVLDKEATVARLPQDQRPISSFGVRLTPLTFRFYAQDRVHAEELVRTGPVSIDAIYQAVNDKDGLRLEFWATDGERVVDTAPFTIAYVEILDADHVLITPPYRYGGGGPLPERVFRRVDEATLEAYRKTPPNVGQLTEVQQDALATQLRGAWISNAKKTFAEHERYGRQRLVSDEAFGRIGMEFTDDRMLRMQFVGPHDRQVNEAKYTLLDAQDNVLIMGIEYPQTRDFDEFVIVLDGEDQLQMKPTSGTHRTQIEADAQTIIFDRVSTQTLDRILTEEGERFGNSTK